MKIQYLIKLVALSLFLGLFFTACEEEELPMEEEIKEEEMEEEEEEENLCDLNIGKIYIEKDGLLRADFETVADTKDWEVSKAIAGFGGDAYLVWKGTNNFNTPGISKLTYNIQINTVGTYQFIWRSQIATGDSNTEHNDTWLRFPDADDFYGQRDGSIVYPKGSGKTPLPEGSGKEGWFKVYMNRENEWFWRATTSDNDPHLIYVEFKEPKIYTMEVSARSAFHAIDQFVLSQKAVSNSNASDVPLSEIICD